jgi:hypothetical protein
MLTVRRELVWDHDIPSEPERDEGFMTFYVGRVLERGTAEDVRALGLDRIRKYLAQAPLPRQVLDFWHWWLDYRERIDGDSHTGSEDLSSSSIGSRSRPI